MLAGFIGKKQVIFSNGAVKTAVTCKDAALLNNAIVLRPHPVPAETDSARARHRPERKAPAAGLFAVEAVAVLQATDGQVAAHAWRDA